MAIERILIEVTHTTGARTALCQVTWGSSDRPRERYRISRRSVNSVQDLELNRDLGDRLTDAVSYALTWSQPALTGL